MKLSVVVSTAFLLEKSHTNGLSFLTPSIQGKCRTSQLSMVLQNPPGATKLQKIEQLKVNSDYLREPLKHVSVTYSCIRAFLG